MVLNITPRWQLVLGGTLSIVAIEAGCWLAEVGRSG